MNPGSNAASARESAGPLVVVAILAGLVAAFHMGKIPAALPALRQDFRLDLFHTGLVVSSFSLLAALGGLTLGLIARRLGARRAGVAGLLTTAAGAAIGALTTRYPVLLGARILEGLGYLLVAVAMPGLINRVCPPTWRALALGAWGAFIPAAMSLMLLISPATMNLWGWRGLWWLTAVLSVMLALLFLYASRRDQPPPSPVSGPRSGGALSPGPMLVALAFTCYTALFAAVAAFLPTFWHEAAGLSIADASLYASLVVAANIAGNVIAGYLVGRGTGFTRLLLVALLGGGGCAALIFAGVLPLPGQVVAALGFTLLSGFLPGALFASIGDIAPSEAALPLVTGMVFQGAGVGQVLGPAALGLVVSGGAAWTDASLLILGIAITGALFGTFHCRLGRR